jgi:hypothetical protein
MVDLAFHMDEVLRLLEEHRTDYPRGMTELEMQQHCADLPLLGLKRAVEQLEAEGKVHRALTDVGSYRIALPEVTLEDVPIGHAAYQ